MGREIRFRAWEKHLKEMITVHDISFETKMINTKSAWRLFDEIELMQYTGLKDMNGTEIYEGDVLKGTHYMNGGWHRIIGKVVFSSAQFCIDGVRQYESIMRIHFDPSFEVIGNIYENPELIGECPKERVTDGT